MYNIDHLVMKDELISDPQRIKNEILDFYKNKLYIVTEQWKPTSNFGNCPAVSEEEKDLFQIRFEEQEVLGHLKMFVIDKAPGLDGFTMGFFTNCREVFKQDIMEVYYNFHSRDFFERSLNATYIALIPRKMVQKNWGISNLLSFIGSIFKIIAKVLVNRLKRVMENR